jgi:hypothetical protein
MGFTREERGDDGDPHRGENKGGEATGGRNPSLAARARFCDGRELGGGLEMGKETSRGVRELYSVDWRGRRAELRRERRWARDAVRRRRDESELLRFRRTVGAVDRAAAAEG